MPIFCCDTLASLSVSIALVALACCTTFRVLSISRRLVQNEAKDLDVKSLLRTLFHVVHMSCYLLPELLNNIHLMYGVVKEGC